MESARTAPNSPPWWFWIVAAFYMLLSGAGVIQLPWAPRDPEPWWAEIAYAAGIIGIFLGSVGMLFRRRWARIFFGVSIVGFLVHRGWLFLLSEIAGELSPFAPVMLFISVLLNLLAIWLVHVGFRQGWIR